MLTVSGTIVEETLRSENNAAPTGSRIVTHYSTNSEEPKRIAVTNINTIEQKNSDSPRTITSVTSVYRIGDTDESTQAAEDAHLEMLSKIETKVVRGSVKEMSDKFIRRESLTSATDKSVYPKAGLILRTQSSRESTPGASSVRSGSIDFDECDIELRTSQKQSSTRSTFVNSDNEDEGTFEYQTMNTSQKQTRSFLNSSGAKVSGVQDVLDRMRNADNGKSNAKSFLKHIFVN